MNKIDGMTFLILVPNVKIDVLTDNLGNTYTKNGDMFYCKNPVLGQDVEFSGIVIKEKIDD